MQLRTVEASFVGWGHKESRATTEIVSLPPSGYLLLQSPDTPLYELAKDGQWITNTEQICNSMPVCGPTCWTLSMGSTTNSSLDVAHVKVACC